jgi:hypothetical protein
MEIPSGKAVLFPIRLDGAVMDDERLGVDHLCDPHHCGHP